MLEKTLKGTTYFMTDLPQKQSDEKGELRTPYRRCYRPMKDGVNLEWTTAGYIQDPDYATNGAAYVRSFYHFQEELQYLFKYIEPVSGNLNTYSYAIQQLLILVCVEVEANFKAIFRDNKYTTKEEHNWTIWDYSRINVSHHLSGYGVEFPQWDVAGHRYYPFKAWEGNRIAVPEWYHAYNHVKHDKDALKEYATFGNLLRAFVGLFVLQIAQFNRGLMPFYEKGLGIGNYLTVYYPEDWKEDELYSGDWKQGFRIYDYDAVERKDECWADAGK